MHIFQNQNKKKIKEEYFIIIITPLKLNFWKKGGFKLEGGILK